MSPVISDGTKLSSAQPVQVFLHDLPRECVNASQGCVREEKTLSECQSLTSGLEVQNSIFQKLLGGKTREFCKEIDWLQSAIYIWIGKFRKRATSGLCFMMF